MRFLSLTLDKDKIKTGTHANQVTDFEFNKYSSGKISSQIDPNIT